MKKLLRIVAIVLGLGIVLAVGAALAIMLSFDPNDYKDQITALVERHTGRKLSLEEDIKLSVFPWLGVDVGALSLGNAPGFGREPFLTSERAQVRVQLLPLLKKEVRMDTVTLQGMTVNLTRAKDGKSNWDDLLQTRGQEGERKAPLPLAAFALGGIELTNATVNWIDHRQGERYRVKDLNLHTEALLPGEPLELALSFTADARKLGVMSAVELKSTLAYDLDAQRYQLTPLDLQARLTGPSIFGGRVDLTLHTAAEADLKSRITKITGLRLSALDAEAQGDLEITDLLSDSPLFEGNLAIKAPKFFALLERVGQAPAAEVLNALFAEARFSGTLEKMTLAPLHVRATLAGATIPKGPVDVTLGTRAELGLDKQILELNDLSVQGLGLEVKGTARAQGFLEEPNYQGTFKLAPFNLRELLSKLGQEPPVTADPKVLTRIAAETGLKASGSGLTLTAMSLRLDETHIKGSLALVDFARPAVEFKLALDALDADRYLPPPGQGEKPKVATPAVAAGAAADLPLETLRAVNVKGDLNIGKLKIAKARLTDLSMRIDTREGDIKLSPIAADLYSGKYSGNIGLDARGSEPRFTLNESFTGIAIEPLLTDLTGGSKLSGVGDVKARLSATGAELEALKRALTGTAEFVFRNGAFKGVNLGRLIRKAQAGFVGPVEAQIQTDFSTLEGTLHLANGRVSNNDLKAKSPLLRVEGEGSADLVSERIDYTLNTTLVATAKGQGGRELGELKGVTVPIRVSGTFSAPKYAPDLATIAKARAGQELEKQKQKLKTKVEEKLEEKLKDQAGDELKRKLKDLLQKF